MSAELCVPDTLWKRIRKSKYNKFVFLCLLFCKFSPWVFQSTPPVIVLVLVIYSIIYWFITSPQNNWHPKIVLSNTKALTAVRPRPRWVKEISCLKVVLYRFSRWNWCSRRFLGFWSFFGDWLKTGGWWRFSEYRLVVSEPKYVRIW